MRGVGFVAAAAALAGCVSAQPSPPVATSKTRTAPYADPALDGVTWDRLQTFESDAAFHRYLNDASAAADAVGRPWSTTYFPWTSGDGGQDEIVPRAIPPSTTAARVKTPRSW